MKYKCKKSFCVDKYDDDGFMIENAAMVIEEGKVYETDESGHMMIGGSDHVHLDAVDDGSWLEITKETLEECFDLLEARGMNVLEKILEEIKKPTNYTIMCGKHFTTLDRVEEIIRSHMDEVSGMRGKRLIDANALDEEARNFRLTITGDPSQATVVRECKESFRRMIDEQPTVYEASDWIPVEDKQAPEKEVIAQNVYDEMMIGYVYYSEEMKWYECVSDDVYLTNVVAWKPLPETYKKHRQ